MYRLVIIKIIGFLFVFLGLYFLRITKKMPVLFIFIGSIIIYICFFGALSKSCEKINFIKKLNANNIKSIKISPTKMSNNRHISLVNEVYCIENKKDIEKICLSLNKVNQVGDDFLKNPKKICLVEIEFNNNKKVAFAFKNTDDVSCISLNSNGESGWHYGKFEANEFGLLLKKHTKH